MVDSAVGRLLAALPVMVVACGVVACGAEPAPPAGTTTAPAPTTTTTITTTTAITTTVTTTTAAPFAAADGRNLDACADGTCEVFVQTGDSLPNASGAGPVQITVEAGMVTITNTGGGMMGSMTGRPGMPQQINNQVFDIVAVEGAQGVLRLSLV